MSFKDFCKDLTEAQKQNWRDFREAEKLLPTNSNIPVWSAVDILRLRRQREKYSSIVMITGSSEHAVRTICQRAGLGRKWWQT